LAGILCLIGAVQNHILPLFLQRHVLDLEGHTKKSSKSTITRHFKKWFLIPTTFKPAHVRRVAYLSIPLRSQTILIYLLLNFIFLCVDYDIFAENIYWPGQTDIQLTGWSFLTFNVWHKWVGRVCLIQTFIHSVCYTMYAFQDGGEADLAAHYEDAYLRWGAVLIPLLCGMRSNG
jgi:hypothetical protein